MSTSPFLIGHIKNSKQSCFCTSRIETPFVMPELFQRFLSWADSAIFHCGASFPGSKSIPALRRSL